MPKKNIKEDSGKNDKKNNISKKETKKQKIQMKNTRNRKVQESQQNEDDQSIDDERVLDEPNEQNSNQNQEENSSSGQNQDSDQQESSGEQSSQSQLAPQNYAIKQMQFRERRGTKMNYLMNRKKDEEEDSFWQKQGQDYFGNLQNQEQDQDYQQSSSGRDQFDSDFDQTESEHEPQQNQVQEPVIDEEQEKQKKKQHELMRKIGAPAPKKVIAKTNVSAKKNQSEKKPVPQPINRYIHQVCTQQQLLGQAAQTQYINWLSLQKLISIENQKKDFTQRQHFLEGQKVVYRDRIGEDGKRHSSYELVGVKISQISDLTDLMNKSDQQ